MRKKISQIPFDILLCMSIALSSCEDSISNITEEIEQLEEDVLNETNDSTIIRKESLAEIDARADEVVNRYRRIKKNSI